MRVSRIADEQLSWEGSNFMIQDEPTFHSLVNTMCHVNFDLLESFPESFPDEQLSWESSNFMKAFRLSTIKE